MVINIYNLKQHEIDVLSGKSAPNGRITYVVKAYNSIANEYLDLVVSADNTIQAREMAMERLSYLYPTKKWEIKTITIMEE